MYLPLIRGRQYDLLALRELKKNSNISNSIIPVIEPVKISSTLISTVKAFEETSSKLIIIINPQVGSFGGELSIESLNEQFLDILKNPAVMIGHYLNRQSSEEIEEIMNDYEIDKDQIVILHTERSLLSIYDEIYNQITPKYNIIPDHSFKRKLNDQNLVILEDKFNKQLRNLDYQDYEDEFFSEEHLYFKIDGYLGFSDYTIVGQEFNEGGFAPYAVAIHIVYPNDENGLHIMHFVSDSNDDISNPAGKFFEAVTKLAHWYNTKSSDNRLNTKGMQQLLKHFENGTYPGLPTLKKLCIMHHIELVDKLLQEVE